MGYHKQFHLRGINYESRKDPSMSRQELIESTRSKDKLMLEEYDYKGDPALMVVNTRFDLDIGVVPAEDVEKIRPHLSEPYSVLIIERYDLDDGRKEGMKLQFCAGEEVSTDDETKKRAHREIPFYKRWWFIVIVIFFIAFILDQISKMG